MLVADTTLVLGDHAVVATGGSRTRTILDASTSIGKSLVGHLIDTGLESCNC